MRAARPDPRHEPVRIERWSRSQFSARSGEAMDVYVRAMQYPTHTGQQRALTARRHTQNDGFACRVALAGDDAVVGFGYGYTTRPGQWWYDLVHKALPPTIGQAWLTDAFELSELHVLPEYQGRGIGRQVLCQLAASIPHATMLLSTPDADTRAFRLYRKLGFVDLTRHYLFPGDSRPFAVLGCHLPLTTTPGTT